MKSVILLESFTIVSLLFVAGALFLTHRFVKPEKRKYCYLVGSLGCIAIHFSEYVIDLINGTAGEMPSNLFLPEWPCNVMMWITLVISVLLFFKENKVRKCLLYITFWVGTVCSVMGIAANFYFLDNPYFNDWGVMKGLLSHVFLVYCCVFPFVEGMVDYSFFRTTLSVLIADVLFILCANYSRFMHIVLGRDPGGTMLESPFESMPWLNLYVIILLSTLAWVGAATIYETLRYEKEDRWYNRLDNIKEDLEGAKEI